MQPNRARDEAGNIWELDAQGNAVRLVEPAAPAGGRVFSLPPNPREVARDARAERAADRQAAAAARAADTTDRTAARQANTDSFSQLNRLAENYNADMTVKAYRVAMQQLGQALNTGAGPQSDLALTYAFAKAMDPESVVRESEQAMVTNSQPWFQAAVERVKREFGMDEAGTFTPEARDALRRQILNSVQQRARIYNTRRDYFAEQARAFGVNPELVIGQHDANPFVPQVDEFIARQTQREQQGQAQAAADGAAVETDPVTGEMIIDVVGGPYEGPAPNEAAPQPGSYQDSPVAQGLSGLNEGLAGLAGLPVDAATGALNLIPRGLNAIAGTELPTIENPVLGSQFLREGMGDLGMIAPRSDDPTNQFIRRTAESVGASAIPLGRLASVPQYLAQLGIGAAGGAGAATARQVAPGNIFAEILGEVAGAGTAGLGALRVAQRGAQRGIEEAIPTTQQLRDQAGEMYRAAEARGATADPTQTQALADSLRQTLVDEGRVSPTGRVSEVYPKAREAIQLVDDYAGQPMTPTQLQTVRQVITDTGSSPDRTERRLGQLLTEAFDNWAAPIAPELPAARDVSSRYLQAQTLEQARERAEASTSLFTASGRENALRNQYRQLDKGEIGGREWFTPEVSAAVQNVNRGNPLSNFYRGLGRFAPTGPVSAAASIGVPAGVAGSIFGGPVGAAAGIGLGVAGGLGRRAATNMGFRAADVAELTARNGGPIDQAPLIGDIFNDPVARAAALQYAKYLQERPQ